MNTRKVISALFDESVELGGPADHQMGRVRAVEGSFKLEQDLHQCRHLDSIRLLGLARVFDPGEVAVAELRDGAGDLH